MCNSLNTVLKVGNRAVVSVSVVYPGDGGAAHTRGYTAYASLGKDQNSECRVPLLPTCAVFTAS